MGNTSKVRNFYRALGLGCGMPLRESLTSTRLLYWDFVARAFPTHSKPFELAWWKVMTNALNSGHTGPLMCRLQPGQSVAVC